jgi:formate-dependent nitrite reductase cytochrome c552 subunit
MSRNDFSPGFLLVFVTLALATSARSAENSCIDCHQQPEFYAQYPKLNEYFQQYRVSPHNQAGVTCDDCHGGNASASSARQAHIGVLPMSDVNSTVYYQKQPDTCGQCHIDKQRQFLRSKHYAALMHHRAAPTCTTCHPAMSGRPELRNIVLHACRNCHYEGNSDDLPLIADQAERVFKQLNIASGLLGWTRVHYESHDWPDGSKERVDALEERYESIVNKVHEFDLQQTDDSTIAILVDLREIFDTVRSEHEQTVK